ncbi:MAG TPA: hypothetical protein VGH67_06565, partial [Solirubrobacteraceae bacterium]
MAAVTRARDAVAGWPLRADNPSVRDDRDPSLARLLARFALSGLLAMVIIGAAAFVIVRRSATSDAITQAKNLTQLAGRGIAAPVITRGVLRGD